jgi:hypothetical protein
VSNCGGRVSSNELGVGYPLSLLLSVELKELGKQKKMFGQPVLNGAGDPSGA